MKLLKSLRILTLVLSIQALIPVNVFANGRAEYQRILVLVGNGNPQQYELCSANLTNLNQTTTFMFSPSGRSVESEPIEINLGPGETNCVSFAATEPGILSELIVLPPGQRLGQYYESGLLRFGDGNSGRQIPSKVSQVWLLQDGKRTTLIGGTGYQYGDTDFLEAN